MSRTPLAVVALLLAAPLPAQNTTLQTGVDGGQYVPPLAPMLAPRGTESELRDIVTRFQTDESALNRRWTVEYSPTRRDRFREYYRGWQSRLRELDFDKLSQRAHGLAERRAVLLRAQSVHPTDYFYALAFARTEPLKPPQGGKSPRLHALNRALRLCPRCQLVHVEVARSLWQLLGRQARPRLAAAAAIETDPEVRTVITELLRPAS